MQTLAGHHLLVRATVVKLNERSSSFIPRSSNGRTAAFGAVNRGSNPCRGARQVVLIQLHLSACCVVTPSWIRNLSRNEIEISEWSARDLRTRGATPEQTHSNRRGSPARSFGARDQTPSRRQHARATGLALARARRRTMPYLASSISSFPGGPPRVPAVPRLRVGLVRGDGIDHVWYRWLRISVFQGAEVTLCLASCRVKPKIQQKS